ncbi:MAG: WecB/TagA/CpsF family glycosyltransferase [Patescibacteria group bacterium]
MEQNKLNIFGIEIDTLSRDQALARASGFFSDGRQHFIVTPNPEILLGAGKDEELWYILNQADLAIPDGIGLKFAAILSGVRLERIAGADLMLDLLQQATGKKQKVAVLNWRAGLSAGDEIKSAVQKKYPGLEFEVFDLEQNGEGIDREAINRFAPALLFITLGSPYQERVMYHELTKLPSVRLAMAVGGAFDFLTGKRQRAPRWFRTIGLEWLWRLVIQPTRWRRIYRAVLVFPYKFLRWKFFLPFFYRPNVVCLLYKKEGSGYKIFIVERTDKKDHWQLPQGGTRDETLSEAGVRELREEIGNDKFRAVAVFPNLWKYDFGAGAGKYPAGRHVGYRGQRQGLFIAEYLGQDAEIKINYYDHSAWHWVEADQLVQSVFSVRQESTRIFLEKFYETLKKH